MAYRSGEEAIAIKVFDRRRSQTYAEIMIMAASNIGSKQLTELIKEYRGELFVEYAYDSQKFLLNSKKTFEKIAKKLGRLNLSLAEEPGSRKKKGPDHQVEFVQKPGERMKRHGR